MRHGCWGNRTGSRRRRGRGRRASSDTVVESTGGSDDGGCTREGRGGDTSGGQLREAEAASVFFRSLRTRTLSQTRPISSTSRAFSGSTTFLELVGVDDDVQRADLRQPRLLVLDAARVDLLPRARRVGLARRIHGRLMLAEVHQACRYPRKVVAMELKRIGIWRPRAWPRCSTSRPRPGCARPR